jgi:hypothetical protein
VKGEQVVEHFPFIRAGLKYAPHDAALVGPAHEICISVIPLIQMRFQQAARVVGRHG